MKRVSKILLRQFAKAARPWLQSWGLLRTSMVFNKAALVLAPGPERVMALAPHMDDETIGCGGALALHAKAGAQIQIVFMTDGRYGNAELQNLKGEQRRDKERQVVALRKEEAHRAARILGIGDLQFIDAEDGNLAHTPAAITRLREMIAQFKPEIVYVPCFLELHPDHLATTRVLLEATRDYRGNFQCHAYEVWTPLFPNLLVRIDDVLEIKKQALAQYTSQLADSDYLHSAVSLNAYRSSGFQSHYGRYAEAYMAADLARYRALYESYLGA